MSVEEDCRGASTPRAASRPTSRGGTARIQHFDPAGVGARDLRECLLIQLRQLAADEPAVRHARTIIDKHIQLLGAQDYATLMRRLHISEPELKAAIH